MKLLKQSKSNKKKFKHFRNRNVFNCNKFRLTFISLLILILLLIVYLNFNQNYKTFQLKDYFINDNINSKNKYFINIQSINNNNTIIQSIKSYDKTINEIDQILKNHPLHFAPVNILNKLEDIMDYIQNQPQCEQVPVITTMANVANDLYWQMIENFIYTMVKFNLSSCTLMICVTDYTCMELCKKSFFPCYNYNYLTYHENQKLPHALEQIAELKLFHMPKALERNVDIFVVDLDVGFLSNPLELIKPFYSSDYDIYVQEDLSFVMNRTVEGWRTWYTVPLPNIGLFLCRGNTKTVRMFNRAWKDYKSITANIKHNPGKDQNKVVNAMISARSYGLKWKYFPMNKTILLDKIYKFQDQTYELGGLAAVKTLSSYGAVAVHTTCYEQKMKVMGLKASNAFYNPRYYNPDRFTLTKKLMYTTESDLLKEIRTMIYLSILTNRSLIIPNILGYDMTSSQYYNGLNLWPGFRVLFMKSQIPNLDIVEPNYYWKLFNQYDDSDVPHPMVITISNNMTIYELERLLLFDNVMNYPRIVINIDSDYNNNSISLLQKWSNDSVGEYLSYQQEIVTYNSLPKLSNNKKLLHRNIASDIIDKTRLCIRMFDSMRGNRSCFDKCD